eukprot:TRINITY_DN479_c0_g1_i2.p1 TRINITY_DN479_c0_g1~~TRINITY_DN479_c0_g1_i2.p1  ORF type:complete len:181 (+),score=14.48 TRINITY_DN479_c0_g1_i2:103-645(+)
MDFSLTDTLKRAKIIFQFANSLTYDDLRVQITSTTILVQVLGSQPIIQGKLYQEILYENSSWQLSGRRISIKLRKKVPQRWPYVISNSIEGDFDSNYIDAHSQAILGRCIEDSTLAWKLLNEAAKKGNEVVSFRQILRTCGVILFLLIFFRPYLNWERCTVTALQRESNFRTLNRILESA